MTASPLLAATLVLAFIAVGEIVSLWSRARIPALLIAMLVAFVLTKVGIIPPDVVTTSTLVGLGTLIGPPLVVHMGTLMPLSVIRKQWRAVLISVAGMVVGVGLVLAIVSPLFGFQYSVAGSGPLAGGIVSTALTTQGLTQKEVPSAILVVPTLVLMLQALPAMPLANQLLRRYALQLRRSGLVPETVSSDTVASPENIAVHGAAVSDETDSSAIMGPRQRTLVTWPDSLLNNQLFLLFLVLLAGTGAYYLGVWTGISYSIWALVLGIGLAAVGILPDKVMERGNSFGLAMAATIGLVISPLLGASMSDILASLVPVVAILLIGMTGILIGGAVMTKLVGWNPRLGMAVALTAMFGFPADFLMVQEVARSTGRDDDERNAIRDKLLPPMLIGGFTSVSAGSVVIASILVGLL